MAHLSPSFFPGISFRQIVGLLSGPLLFLLILVFTDLEPGNPRVTGTLAVAIWMALWWITEVVPLAATALLPVALFPLLGIMDGKEVSATYFNHVIFLFIGGFLVAIAMEKWNLHKRIALRILLLIGISPSRILLGFMAASAFMSMWISNTATAMMMIPIVMAVIYKLEESVPPEALRKYAVGLLLGIAYGASIGGIATLIGTPPNLSFARIFSIMFPQAPEISFASWLIFALPMSLLVFTLVWIYLYRRFKPAQNIWDYLHRNIFITEYQKLGKATWEEKVVLTIFSVLAVLWIFRSSIDFGRFMIPGWTSLLKLPDYVNDGTIAIGIALFLFIIPSKNKPGARILDWKSAAGLPWHIVLLFGGGFALASGFKESGLSLWFGEQLQGLAYLHPVLIILLISLTITFLTELTSNTATAEVILPILAGLSVVTKIHPLFLMIPATISASMAFMMPVATPPNAIIFGTNRIRVSEMAQTGLIINLIGALIITLGMYLYGRWVFNVDPTHFPWWALTE